MRVRLSHIPMVAILAAGSVALICGAAFSASSGTPLQAATTAQVAAIKIDYPLDGSVFPPEITPPTFLWHDANETSKRWVFEVSFGGAPQPFASMPRAICFKAVKMIPTRGLTALSRPSKPQLTLGSQTSPPGTRSSIRL